MDGNGTAELNFTPRFNEAGRYPLRVAAFDEAGEVAIKDTVLVIDDTYVEGDANCDGRRTSEDIDAMIRRLFEPKIGSVCMMADANGDTRFTAADVVQLLILLDTIG